MAKLARVYDPDETERRINLILKDAVCPGLLEFMSELPYGNETPLIRGVFYQWFIHHSDAGTLDDALNNVLSGAGGLIAVGSQGTREPHSARNRKRVPKQRSVTVKAGGRQPATGSSDEPALSYSTVAQDPQPALQPPAQPQPPEPHQQTESDLPEPGIPATEPTVVPAPSPPALQPADQHPLPVAQMDVVNDTGQMPDAEQVALLNSMGTMFP
ncbi:hypothetical protein [Pseudomonas fluorescens]|uniref:Uncharacterized protein n=1 Tax=Pseudomonas fluorescens TaxID=294 RepID=A0A5E7QNE8_PSEFL|nr:hypothetical protein [Pseudomonas fluorescens]VVP60413.1 hypothetical protein PS880_06148 [Pseudomonas fluorescens]